jgi:predicted nucleotide-binding protein
MVANATSAQITNFLMDDLSRYYAQSSARLQNLHGLVRYIDGLPPDLRSHQEKMRERLEAKIEIFLAALAVGTSRSRPSRNSKNVFVVHGRNEQYRTEVCAVISALGLNPVVLHEQPNKGRTIIEKFEQHSDVGFAVVILSGDDHGKLQSAGSQSLKARPRQNVVLEFGFFLGSLGRERVCPLYEPGVELPSDYDGVLWVELKSDMSWRDQLRRELEAAGILPAG